MYHAPVNIQAEKRCTEKCMWQQFQQMDKDVNFFIIKERLLTMILCAPNAKRDNGSLGQKLLGRRSTDPIVLKIVFQLFFRANQR